MLPYYHSLPQRSCRSDVAMIYRDQWLSVKTLAPLP